MVITVELLPLPPGDSLPVQSVRAMIKSYRSGGATADQLIAAVDRHGQALDERLNATLARDVADYHRTLRRAALLASWIELRRSQVSWLRAFPHSGRDPGPLLCRLASGHVIAVPLLLEPLHDLELQQDVDGRKSVRNDSVRDGRAGAGASMQLLDRAGLSLADVAGALDVAKTTAWRWMVGATACPPEFASALERLTGDEQLAREIVEAIPSRNGH